MVVPRRRHTHSALLLALLLCVAPGPPAAAQDSVDGVTLLLTRLQQALATRDDVLFTSLFSPTLPPEGVAAQRASLTSDGAVRFVLRERDRLPLDGAADDAGYRLVVETFEETARQARVVTTRLDVARAGPDSADGWHIIGGERLSAVEGLYELRLDTRTQYRARNLEIVAPDLVLALTDGTVFPIESEDGVTGLVLLGRGEMRFSPAPEAERGQLRLFSGEASLVTPFEQALVRFSPSDYATRVANGALVAMPVDARAVRRAEEVMAREVLKSYVVDVSAVSERTWHLLPRERDFLAEVRTDGHGTLTYARYAAQPEDISLVRRDRRLTIALYASPDNANSYGRSHSDGALREYDVLDNDIEVFISPARRLLNGRARLEMQARVPLSTMTLRLADGLAVTAVSAVGIGPLGFLRLRGQNALFVRLPATLLPGTPLTLVISYAGAITSQSIQTEGLQTGSEVLMQPLEPHLLLSSASFWYPQNPFIDYSTATLRIHVPSGHTAIGSGRPLLDSDDDGSDAAAESQSYLFRADRPLRYFAVVISRFTRIDARTIDVPVHQAGGVSEPFSATIDSHPLQRADARRLIAPMNDILHFYATLLGDTPYPSTALALVEAELPGGHSPGYFVLLNNPLPESRLVWRNDPAAFDGFPEFFLAHELAHQWWGQAVSGKNYHEQWISEGFAQYFAALYARHARGDRVFEDMLGKFRRWSLSESEMGPVRLGQRLGQIRGGRPVFRALVYNKGAAVLHMLRRLVGDEVFFAAIRRFYQAHRYSTAGTDDLQLAFEQEWGRPLGRFFDNWIYGQGIPRLAHTITVAPDELTLRFEQLGETVFDLPVTVALDYEDGRSENVIVVLSERHTERRVSVHGRIRSVDVNSDAAALAEFVDD